MAEETSPSLHMERLVPLLVLVRPPGCTTTAVHGNRHLHECPVDALRCILFDVCTVCLSLWCIIEPHEGLSEPELNRRLFGDNISLRGAVVMLASLTWHLPLSSPALSSLYEAATAPRSAGVGAASLVLGLHAGVL